MNLHLCKLNLMSIINTLGIVILLHASSSLSRFQTTVVLFHFAYIYTQEGSSKNVDPSSEPVNCTKFNESIKALSNCSSFSWGTANPHDSPGNCSGENYTGSVCRQQLLAWQKCAVGGAEYVLLDLSLMEQSQEEREKDVSQFLHFLCELIQTGYWSSFSIDNYPCHAYREFWIRSLSKSSSLACLPELFPSL